MLWVFLYFGLSAVALGAWYWWSRQSSRNRAIQILHWLECALGGAGHVAGMRWVNPSEFEVPVRMTSTTFRDVKVMVQLRGCELPLTWLLSKLRKNDSETLTFTADLDFKPNFALELHNMRWFARSRRELVTQRGGWQFDSPAPVVLTTRTDWQREIAQVMQSLINTENREMMDVTFSKSSPHFRATMPLDCISPEHLEVKVFEALRDLADGISSAAA